MTLEEMMKVAEALGLDATATLDDFLAKIGSLKDPKPEDKPKPEPDPTAAAAAAIPGDKPEEVVAAVSAVASLSGKPSLVASVADIRTWHASHVTLAAERKVLADREAVLESAERRKLCVEMVTLGGRVPATIWADDKSTAPKPYLAAMPIADLRTMHADTVKANGLPAAITPPVGADAAVAGGKDIALDDGRVVTLSARECAMCTEMKLDPKTYAASKPPKKG